MAMVAFLITITVVADSLGVGTDDGFTVVIEDEPPSEEKTTVWSVVDTFWRIITFQVDDFPPALNLIVFMPLTFGIVYIIADILKDLVPFT